jgi:hypothetical protein
MIPDILRVIHFPTTVANKKTNMLQILQNKVNINKNNEIRTILKLSPFDSKDYMH